MTVNEFVEMTKNEPLKWINYCEIIITRNGMIELARPSHLEKLLQIQADILNISAEELKDKFPKHISPVGFMIERNSCILVWFAQIICSGKNK